MRGTVRWRFGAFEADAQEHRLSRSGHVVALSRKSFALLVALLRRPGELVTKAELFETVWPGVVVTDAALSQAVHELRAALDDDRHAPRFIATVYGLGFRFVAGVTAVAGPATPAGRRSEAPRWLVGREAELQRLDDALAAAHDGCRSLVIVSGEAGIGKTALVDAFVAAHARSHDVWVAQGRCIEQFGPGDAHLPVLEALEQLSRQVGAAAFLEVFSRYAPSWLPQLPWLARDADAAVLERAGAETTRQRMLREVAHALDELSVRKTIVLWLEDLHWSDPSSVELMSYLAGRRDAARLLVIGSFRPADAVSAARALQRTVLRLVQRGQAEEMVLRPLTRSEVGRYLSERFPGSGDPRALDELAAVVHRRTEGNPLFAVSMIDDLVRRGGLFEQHGRWHLAARVAHLGERMPESLRRLVHEQIEHLSDADQRCIEAAAVAGPSFSAAAAAAALQAGVAETEDRCARLARQGQLLDSGPAVSWPDGTVSSGFRFTHALYWQGAYERVPEGRLAEWQRLIGERMEQAYAAQCAGVASELAVRFEAARDAERSVRYLRMAGTAALSRYAYPECIASLRHGLELVTALPAPKRARHELDLLLPLGAALMSVQSYASDDVRAVYDRALALSRDCSDTANLVRVLRGQWNVAFSRGDLAAARSTAEDLLHKAESAGDDGMRVDALTKLGETCIHQGDLLAARAHLQAAFDSPAAAASRAGARGVPRVAAYLAWALWYTGDPRRAVEMSDTALDLARYSDSPHSKAFALGLGGWLAVLRGDADRAKTLAAEQLTLADEYGLAYWKQWSGFLTGTVMARQGDAERGSAMVQAALDGMQAMGGTVGIQHLHCVVAEAQLALGRPTEAQAALAAAVAHITRCGDALYLPEVRRLEGIAARAADDGPGGRAAARRKFEEAMHVARTQGARALELRAAMSLAQLVMDDGDALGALAVLQPLRVDLADAFDVEDRRQADDLLRLLSKAASDAD